MVAMLTPIQSARTPLNYALRYARLGWHVFPLFWVEPTEGGALRCACGDEGCKSPGKHPIPNLVQRGQHDATTEAARIERWWAAVPRAHVGVFLAPSGLVAIDIDPRNGGLETIQAVERAHGALVSDVTQLTGGGGEHRVFSIPAGMQVQLPGKLGPGVDVKANGYIVVEPSGHISGGSYAWEASSDPLDGCIPSPLPDWLRSLRPIVPAADAASAVLEAHQVLELRSALAVIDPEPHDTWVSVGMALHATGAGPQAYGIWCDWSIQSAKFDAADQMRRWRSFKSRGLDGLSTKWIFAEAQRLGWVNPRSAQAVAFTEPPPVRPVSAQPAAAFSTGRDLDAIPVASLARACDWISGLFDNPTPAITTMGGLALASVITGRLYRSEAANWTSMLYTVVGPSGVGKNYIKTGIERLLMAAGLPRLIAGDFYTHQAALYWALHESPCHICISDEFGENFLEARKNNNANKLTVFKALKKAYSDADHLYKPESYSMSGLSKKQRTDSEIGPVLNPSVTLLGLSTLAQFWGEIRIQHIEGGLMNRFVIATVDAREANRRELGHAQPPAELVDWVRTVRRVDEPLRHTAFDLAPSPIAVPFDRQAHAVFERFRAVQETVGDELESAGLGAMPRRWRENAMRMATGLAASERPERPTVTGEIADWSCRKVHACGMSSIEKIRANAGENDYHVQLNQVLRMVRDAGTRGVTDFEIKGALRGVRRRDLAEVLAHLQEAGLVTLGQRDAGPKGGRPAKVWIASEPEGDA